MPLETTTIPLPAAVESVSTGDVDGDGKDELIVESRVKITNQPDGRTLTILRVAADGTASTVGTVELGNRPAFWDIAHGLWLVDREGLAQIAPSTGGLVRIARFPTALAALGPATPQRASIAHDLLGDGHVELVAWTAGKYAAWTTSGSAFGSIPAPGRGDLDTGYLAGGDTVATTIRPPSLAVQDVDGDGRQDLLLPHDRSVDVYYTDAALGARAASIKLPFDLDPDVNAPIAAGETRRDVSGVWFQDFDADKRSDLVVQRTVYSGGWFGATTELLFLKGTGSGFGAAVTTPIAEQAFEVRPLDVDGDGRPEILAALVDLGIGNITRALVSKEVQAQLSLFRVATGAAATPLHNIRFPIEHPENFHATLQGDVDGDKRLDLVTDDGDAGIDIYRGTTAGLSTSASWTVPLTVPSGEGTLLVHDLDGDGRAELLLWGKNAKTATLVRVR